MSRIPTDDLASKTDNAEQRGEGQAQDGAADALGEDIDLSEDSEHGALPGSFPTTFRIWSMR